MCVPSRDLVYISDLLYSTITTPDRSGRFREAGLLIAAMTATNSIRRSLLYGDRDPFCHAILTWSVC